MIRKLLTLILFFIPLLSKAQFRKHLKVESDSLGYFLGKSFLVNSDSTSLATANGVDSLWQNDFNYYQKKEFVNLIKELDSSAYRPRPHLYKIIRSILAAKNNGHDVSQLIQHISDYNKRNFSLESANKYLGSLSRLYENGVLSKKSRFTIQLSKPKFNFILPELIVEAPVENLENTEEEIVYGESFDEPIDYNNEWQVYDDNQNTNSQSSESLLEIQNRSIVEDYASQSLTELEGAIISFENTDLLFIQKSDTFLLKNTKGKFSPIQEVLIGEGGTLDWSRLGLSSDSVFAKLKTYELDLKTTDLKSQKAKLSYIGKLASAIEGELVFRLQDTSRVRNLTFPRFTSYYANHKIDNIAGQNIKLTGGFSLLGKKMTNQAVIPHLATALCSYDTKDKFILAADLFEFSDSTLVSEDASLKIYHHLDSIFHPSLDIHYNAQDTLFWAQKRKGSSYEGSPFIASFFDLDIKADYLEWKYNSDSLDISILSAKDFTPAFLESRDYYNEKNLDGLSKNVSFHPLYLVYYFSKLQQDSTFYLLDLSEYYKLNEKILAEMMKKLREHNFISYDEVEGKITVLKKTLHYIYAKNKKKDYDDLSIPSRTASGPNMTINLEKDYMNVRGIHKFFISKKLDVFIIPNENKIQVLHNRDFKFNGQLYSGTFEFIGKDFTFKYDEFLIDLAQIDSIKFHVKDSTNSVSTIDNKVVSKDKNNSGEEVLSQTIDQTFGTLYINQPDNKSGIKTYPKYPYFNSLKGAYVYFDSPDILDGTYDKSVYFEVPPFQVDSMNAQAKEAIGFNGRFVSGGIFPDIETKLHIMSDNSLGFEFESPNGSLPLYGDKGSFSSKIKLDKKGIRGEGKIEYLTTTLDSKDFIFYPDSVTAKGERAVVEAIESNGVSYPDLQTSNYKMLWKPSKDSLFIYNQDSLMQLYGETAKLDGAAVVSKSGVYGQGILTTRGTETKADEYRFKKSEFSARNASFEVKSDLPEKPAVLGEDVKLMFNIAENFANISPETEGDAAISYPYTQFKTSISQARWELDNNTISMTKPEEVDISQSYFYSTKPELDSLVFSATDALYDMNSQELNIKGIPFIKVADAKIIPNNNEIKIYEDANIENLNNAQLLIDTLNEYHHLVKGEIEIASRHKFSGKATYRFVNTAKDTFDIKFNDFEHEFEEQGKKRFLAKQKFPNSYTVAGGEVLDQKEFLLSPGMFYKGHVKMSARKKALELDGYVKLDLRDVMDYDTWIRYENLDGNQEKIIFDYETAKTEEGDKLLAGLFYDEEFTPYVVFVGDRKSEADQAIFSPKGMLHYDEQRKVFAIEDTVKLNGDSYAGSLFTYKEDKSEISLEGQLNLTDIENPFSTEFNVQTVGSAKGSLDSEEIDLSTLARINMKLPNAAIDVMANKIIQYLDLMGGAKAETDRNKLFYKMAEIIGNEGVQEYKNKSIAQYINLSELSSEFSKSMVFSNLDLKWSKENKAWRNSGKIGISNILYHDINSLTEGYFEIKKTEEGDLVRIFFKYSPKIWFFFEFNTPENHFISYSSLSDYNDIIASESEAGGLGVLEFGLGELEDVKSFLNKFTYDYMGSDQDYKLEMPVEKSITSGNEPEENLLEETQTEASEDEIFEEEEVIGSPVEEKPKEAIKKKNSKKKQKKIEASDEETLTESEEEEIFGDEDDGF